MTIGIMCAMPEEAARLAAELSREREHTHGGRTYFSGTFPGLEGGGGGVLVHSRIGKVAAAATAQHLIDIHRVDRILFTGVAGGLAPEGGAGIEVGDIVVAANLWQHDMDASPLFPPLEIPLLGLSAIPADVGLSKRLHTGAIAFAQHDFHTAVPAPVRAELNLGTPKVHIGDIASGDRFISTAADRADLRHRIPTALCVEMEGAAVAQVCHEHHIPLGVVRIISDSADTHAATDFTRFIRDAASIYGLGIIRRYLAGS